MFHRTQFIVFLIFTFIATRILSMENPTITVNSDELRNLVRQYAQEAVSKTINNNSTSYFSSTLQFVSNNYKGISQILFYGTLIGGILGFSASKYYWLTMAKLDALLEKKEQKAIGSIDKLKLLIDESREGVKTIYQNNLIGISAGFAALDNRIEGSFATLDNRFKVAYSEEQAQYLELLNKSKQVAQSIDQGVQDSNVTLKKIEKLLRHTQKNNKTLLAQKNDLLDLESDIEKEFDAAEKEFLPCDNQMHNALQSLAESIASDKQDIQQTLIITELTVRLLEESLRHVNPSKQENQKKIQTAFEILQQQAELLDQLEALVNNSAEQTSQEAFFDQLNGLTPLPGSK